MSIQVILLLPPDREPGEIPANELCRLVESELGMEEDAITKARLSRVSLDARKGKMLWRAAVVVVTMPLQGLGLTNQRETFTLYQYRRAFKLSGNIPLLVRPTSTTSSVHWVVRLHHGNLRVKLFIRLQITGYRL